jgi:hypothetical protein
VRRILLISAFVLVVLGTAVSTGAFTGGDEAVDGVFLNPADSANGQAYTEIGDDGQIRVELTDLNPQATTTVDDVFTISSTNERSRVWIEHDGGEGVDFYRMDTSESIGGESERIALDRNESVSVGIEVDTGQSEVVLTQITVRAEIQPTATPPAATPTDTPEPLDTDTPDSDTPTETPEPDTPTPEPATPTETATSIPGTDTPESETPTNTPETDASDTETPDSETPTDEPTATDTPTDTETPTDTPDDDTSTESPTDAPTTVDAGVTPGDDDPTPTATPPTTASPPTPATTAPPQGENATDDGITVSTPDDTEIGGFSPLQLGGVVAALAALGAGLLAFRAFGSTASLTLSAAADSELAVAPGELAGEWYDPVDGGFDFRYAESDPWTAAAGDGPVSFERALSVTNTSGEPALVDVDPDSVPEGATLSADGVDLTEGPVRLDPGDALDIDIDLDPAFDPDGDVDIRFRRTPVE